jgi:hypothetical protein
MEKRLFCQEQKRIKAAFFAVFAEKSVFYA